MFSAFRLDESNDEIGDREQADASIVFAIKPITFLICWTDDADVPFPRHLLANIDFKAPATFKMCALLAIFLVFS